MLKLGDFPIGWRGEKSSSDDGGQKCFNPDLSSLTETGRADSRDFTKDESFVTSMAVIMKTGQQATTAYKRVASEQMLKCLTDYMKGGLSDEGGKVTGVSYGRLSFPLLGDRSAAYQVEMHMKTNGINVSAYADLVFVQRTRAFAMLAFVNVFSPFPDDQKEHLARLVASRMKLPTVPRTTLGHAR